MAASVSAYAVSRTFFASGYSSPASSKNSTPVVRGIRWSTRRSATASPRNFSFPKVSIAAAAESAAALVGANLADVGTGIEGAGDPRLDDAEERAGRARARAERLM